MNGSRRGIAGLVFASCATGSVLAVGCSGPEPKTDVLEDVATGQSRVVVCNDYDNLEDREAYVISAMNRKLYYFPEFAAAIGMSSVSDCDGARAFARGYLAYRDAHPRFDANQPPSPAPSIPDDPAARSAIVTETVTKLGNGAPPGAGFAFPNESVALLFSSGPNRNTGTAVGCSGTFIAKNWILTAAHCMNTLTDVNGKITFDGNTNWSIAWSDAGGGQVHTLNIKGNAVKQFSDGAFMGSLGTNSPPEDDLALLYLDVHVFDPFLPPVTENGAAMRLSLSPPRSTDVSSIAGWGPVIATAPSNTFVLDAAPAGSLDGSSVKDFSFTYQRASASDASVCHGDSGGPIYRNQTVGGKTVPVLVGVTSSILAPGQQCTSVGQTANFARIDLDVKPFIESRMNVMYGTGGAFTCREFNLSGSDAYAECWGLPCADSSKCAGSTGYCSRFGTLLNSEYATCPVCSYTEVLNQPLGTRCECISGQCLNAASFANGF